jgi:hypothetical protein
MPYDTSVVAQGNHAHRLLRDEQRVRLAHDALGRVIRSDGTVHVADLPRAGFSDLLGQFWAWYGWAERRRLARARNVDAVFLDIVLDGAFYTPTRLSDAVLHIGSAALRRGLGKLTSADEIRTGLKKWRLEEVRKARAEPCAATTKPCAATVATKPRG